MRRPGFRSWLKTQHRESFGTEAERKANLPEFNRPSDHTFARKVRRIVSEAIERMGTVRP